MVNRTGTYFAFDGLGQTNPANSDFRYYAQCQAWSAGKNIEFKFVNSHEKASAVRSTSLLDTLKASIRQRLAASKNMVIILSNDTRKSGSLLSYEVEQAVDRYQIPLIIAHAGYKNILDPSALNSRWPTALATRINSSAAKAIHIPYRQTAMLQAIKQFSVNHEIPTGSLVYYTEAVQRRWGYIT